MKFHYVPYAREEPPAPAAGRGQKQHQDAIFRVTSCLSGVGSTAVTSAEIFEYSFLRCDMLGDSIAQAQHSVRIDA
jgi:hypothetical protein